MKKNELIKLFEKIFEKKLKESDSLEKIGLDSLKMLEIMAFNDMNNNGTLINYGLYDENGANTLNYSSFDAAFDSNLPSSVENAFESHNLVSRDDKSRIEERMNNYNSYSNPQTPIQCNSSHLETYI